MDPCVDHQAGGRTRGVRYAGFSGNTREQAEGKNVGLHRMSVEAGELISIRESCQEEMTTRTLGTF
jgi:hypothetical protein